MQQGNENIITTTINRAGAFTLYPALSIMVLLRHGVGYRLLHPGKLIILFATLTLFASCDNNHFFRPLDLFVFAVLMLIAGLWQRCVRWLDLKRGVQHHSYYIGTSWLEKLKWRDWVCRNRVVPRFVDSFFCAFIGLGIYRFSPMLGAWLIISGACLLWVETAVHHRKLHRKLDTMDGLVESGIQGEHVEEFSTPVYQQVTADAGVPTGVGPDIAGRIPGRNKNA